jgi:hypothetical protein
MKKILLLGLLLITLASYSQKTAFYQTTDFAFKVAQDTTWSTWTDNSPCNYPIVMDLKNKSIVIANEAKDTYSIVFIGKPFTMEPNSRITEYICLDKINRPCTISFVLREGKYLQLFVIYSQIIYYYNMEKI